MNFSYFIANRYFKSRSKSKFVSFISLISISGIALGVAVLIIAFNILNGFEQTISDKIINFDSHIIISAFGNRNIPEDSPMFNSALSTFENEIESIIPFVSKEAIIKSRKRTEGINLQGISQKSNTSIKNYIVEGDFDFQADSSIAGIVMGRNLAEKLLLNLGDKVTLFSLQNDQIPTIENPPAIEPFYLTGIYESGMASFDNEIAFIDFGRAQSFLEIGENISGFNIRLNDVSRIDSVSNKLQNKVRYPYFVRSVYRAYIHIFTWIELQKKPIPIILGLIILVAVFNVIGTLLIVVLEKTSAIGTMKSMGASNKQILKIFIYKGIILNTWGIVIGNLLAFGLSIMQSELEIIQLPESIYFISSVPIDINLNIHLVISAVAFVLGLLAVLIPSRVASKINPLSAIRFN